MSATLGFLVLWGLRRELLCRDFDCGPQGEKVQAGWEPIRNRYGVVMMLEEGK